jgi:hypothetical protein
LEKLKRGEADGLVVAKLDRLSRSVVGGAPASSYVKAGLEPVHIIDASGEPPFENGAENLISGTEFVKVGFYKDLSGIVHLQGQLLVSGSKSAFTLPEGFRPQKSEIFDGVANEEHGGEIRIDPDGTVHVFDVFEPSLGSVMLRTD